MDFKQFMEYMRGMVEAGTKQTVRVEKTMKNNGKILHGLLIMDKEINLTPIIYLEPYYEMYKQGERLEGILEEIINTYLDRPRQSVDMSFFMKFDCVRGKIVYRVVNAEANKEFLETVPHERVLDLAKIYYVLFTDEILDNATITINKYHMKNWGVTEEDIRQAAEKNTEKLLTAKMSSMQSIIKGMRAVECEDTELDRAFSGIGIEMYVLTNHLKMFGASAVFYKDILKSIAESVENDLYIIPSSIHETILIPYDRNVAADRLNEMVMQVNETQLEKEEVLANHIYIYRRNTNNIEIL